MLKLALGVALLGLVAGCARCEELCAGGEDREECEDECECEAEEEDKCDKECKEMCDLLGPGWGQTGCLRHCGCAPGQTPTSEYDPPSDDEESSASSLRLASQDQCYLTCMNVCLGKLNNCLDRCLESFCSGYKPPPPVTTSLCDPWTLAIWLLGTAGVYGSVRCVRGRKNSGEYTRLTQ